MTDPFRREFFGPHSLPDLARGPPHVWIDS
jgi:hypothetical protein